MKKSAIIMISAAAGAVFLILAIAFLIPMLKIGISQKAASETFVTASQSPDGTYQLEAYRTEPGATVDFSIRVYIVRGEGKERIYDAYHEQEAVINWENDTTVSINGKVLDLSKGETYNWRTQSRQNYKGVF